MKASRFAAVVIVSFALMGSAAGVASSASPSPTAPTAAAAICDTGHVFFAKTKFVFHAGLAFGVFHHFIYKPFKAGAFKSGAPGRLKAAVKAGLAALFVYHELKLACKDAQNSSLLRPLLAPLTLIVTAFNKLAAKLKSGQFGNSDFSSAQSAVTGIEQKSGSLGLPIKEFVAGFSGG